MNRTPTGFLKPREGDRCIMCGHWWWRDGMWHSLLPFSVKNNEAAVRDVVCPVCTSRLEARR